MSKPKLRKLVIVCGDQLDHESAVFDDFDAETDAILMTEAADEASYILQSKRRIALFFAAMRHFREAMREAGRKVLYHEITGEDAPDTLAESLTRTIRAHDPDEIVMVQPGDLRVLRSLRGAAGAEGKSITLAEDRHFFCTEQDFADWAEGRKSIVLEDFYRQMRKRTGYLMDDAGQPVGGQWNFDKDNRETFGKDGPGLLPGRDAFGPDAITEGVLADVERRFSNNPGSLEDFAEPVSREDAHAALKDFIRNRLPDFGTYQDAMWEGDSTLYHSRLSVVLNLKLLSPREACEAAIEAHENDSAPLNAVEGFVRQILGWREFIRGIYWLKMPEYAELNSLDCDRDVPEFFWTGDTDMACLHDMITRLLKTGYAHHIERLMGMGLYLLLHGTHPYKVHEWHMGLYMDAIDWVSLPNTLGMSQHGDGGIVGTKPYCASGSYINRMSNYCGTCRFNPKQATGESACPFTTLYWDFLARHRERFGSNRRMKLQLANLDRKSESEIADIRKTAKNLRSA